MFGLHNVPLTQLSFREARQIYLSPLHACCTLAERRAGEQNGTYLTLSARQLWSARQLPHAAVCARAILANVFASCTLEPRRLGRGIYSLDQSPKAAAHAVEWRIVLSLAIIDRSAHIACVKMCKNLEIIGERGASRSSFERNFPYVVVPRFNLQIL